LHYQVKKSYEDLLVSFEEKNDSVLVYIVSDQLENIKGNLSVIIMDFDGKIVFTDNVETIVKSNASSIYYYFDKSKLKGDINLNNLVLSATFNNENTQINSLFYFVKPKDLLLQKPHFEIKNLRGNRLEITSDKLAKNVYLYATDISIIFEDNYFDLLPNETKIIQVSGKYSKTDFFKIRAKSLFDAK
jgi:beta-mannosidase